MRVRIRIVTMILLNYKEIVSGPQKESPKVRKLQLIKSILKDQVPFIKGTGLGINIAQFLQANQTA